MTGMDGQPGTGQGSDPAGRWSRRGAVLAVISALLVLLPPVGAVVAGLTRDSWMGACVGSGGLVVFLTICAPLCAVSLVPTYAVAVGAGYLYGPTLGSVTAVGAILLGAWIGFRIAVLCAGDALLDGLGPRVDATRRALLESPARTTATVIGLVRLAPVTPFAATNLLMAGAGVPLAPYLVGTLVGLAPRTALVAVAGSGLAELEIGRGAATSGIWTTLGLLAVALVGLTLVARRIRSRLLAHPSGREGAAPTASGP